MIVPENMFGSILSGVSTNLVGAWGMAASARIGDTRAMTQSCRTTAPGMK